MRKVSVHLTNAAREACSDPDILRKAAQAAIGSVEAPGSIEFLKFTSKGKQFAISARLVIDVDYFPNRVPDRVIRRTPR